MARYLVTGCAGFIGCSLGAALLASESDSVIGIDRLSDYYPLELKLANLDRLHGPNFEFVNHDLAKDELAHLLEGVNAVFHQAGQPGVRPSWGEGFDVYTRDNIIGTQRLLEACARLKEPPRFIYASSSSVYGDALQFPTSEYALPSPISPYGTTKLAGEHLVAMYAKQLGIKATSLRYFTVYGPGQRPDMAFQRFCTAALRREQVQVYGDGTQVRDFTYIDDVVAANLLAARATRQDYRVYNVAGGTSTSINEVLTLIADLTGSEVPARHIGKARGDVARTGGDTRLIQQELGWAPKVDIREGLQLQLAHIATLASDPNGP